MNTLRSLTVGVRLAIGFSFILLMLFACVALSEWQVRSGRATAERMANVVMAKERLVAEWGSSVSINGARTIAVTELTNPERVHQLQQAIKATSARITELQKALDGYALDAAEDALLDEVARRRKDYSQARDLAFKLKESSPEEAATQVRTRMEPALHAYVGALAKMQQHQSSAIAAMRDEIGATAERSSRLMMILAGVATLLSVGVALAIARSIRSQLGGEPSYAAEVADRIASGDLSQQVTLGPDDTSSLLFSMSRMRDSLSTIVGEVRHSTREIAGASTEVAGGNLDLSARTEQQAGALEETASSMEELTSTIRQTADNARQANALAQAASATAVRGGAVVTEVVSTMDAINQSSKKIADIIGVIDGIAFQTNILALNAAVEAARAGEQGRGFAVVASEVRNLAQRSAAAAREIKDLINDSVARVDAGGKLVQQAGATMDDIVASIARVTDVMGEITSASAEQSVGIDQVNAAIVEMDDATQQNAALVEQAAAAAASLREQADRLEQLVGTFTVAAEPHQRASAPVARRHAALLAA
ncbi:methyl-accepting chemotaxis protein [Pseudoduganella sp. GCM10020061]|uniref:methyl-accepting chemotaxis protein n=1 Tax=Pseudoduganella sp. GCM10020061 TaxID=3317345 RepID=UPI003635FB1C